MPTYQYACTDCGDRLEVVQRFSDDPLTVCAACDGELRKVFSPVGIVFKGSGFYRTDSRNGSVSGGSGKDKEKAGAESSASSDNGSGKSGSDKSEKGSKSETGGKSGSDAGSSGSSGSGTAKSGTGSAAGSASGTGSKVA